MRRNLPEGARPVTGCAFRSGRTGLAAFRGPWSSRGRASGGRGPSGSPAIAGERSQPPPLSSVTVLPNAPTGVLDNLKRPPMPAMFRCQPPDVAAWHILIHRARSFEHNGIPSRRVLCSLVKGLQCLQTDRSMFVDASQVHIGKHDAAGPDSSIKQDRDCDHSSSEVVYRLPRIPWGLTKQSEHKRYRKC